MKSACSSWGGPTPRASKCSGGSRPGARYVAENSYLIKADIEKSGASHDH